MLSRRSLTLTRTCDYPSLLGVPSFLATSSGRAAIALAFRQLGLAAGDEVLLPAYHCLAMVGPVLAVGAVPVYYPMRDDLSIDVREFRSCISARTRAALAVHYFGFLQDLTRLRTACDEARIALIEDCAHAFYGSGTAAVGTSGDFAIGCLNKFFPTFDGGCLVSRRRDIADIVLTSPSTAFELKAAWNILARAIRYSDSRALKGAFNAVSGARRLASSLGREQLQGIAVPSASEGGLDFDDSWTGIRASQASRLVAARTDHRRATQRRRDTYRRLLDELGAVPGGHPLYDTLPDGVVPYVFPFVLENPAVSFAMLWEAGIPLFRWEQFAGGDCAVTRRYATQLVQFPCHQELSDRELAWMSATARRVLSDGRAVRQA